MAPSSTIGRHAISTRFTANVRILYTDYPTKEELLHTYTEYSRVLLTNAKLKQDKA